MDHHTYVDKSFDKSLYHRGNEFLIPKSGKMSRPFYLNGKKTKAVDLDWKKDPLFYKPDVMTDYALAWMNQAKKEGEPIFLYMAYHVAHYPLQARPEEIEKYKDTYKVGYDVIRAQRFEKMKKLGVLTDKHVLTEPLDNINPYFPNTMHPIKKFIPKYRPWDTLTEEEQADLALEMNVYAAMIDRMDQNIGRLIDWLKENGEFENTIFMYLSDNGASAYDANHDFNHPPGGAESFRSLGVNWASVANTPFKYYKQYGHEGGSNTHFIIHWPGQIPKGQIVDGPGHITDLFPTILEAAGTTYPENMHGEKTLPLQGESLIPIARGEKGATHRFLYSGHRKQMRSYRQGEWKIVRAMNGPWELYNMIEDPSETKNLADQMPEKVTELAVAYEAVELIYDKYKGKK